MILASHSDRRGTWLVEIVAAGPHVYLQYRGYTNSPAGPTCFAEALWIS